MNRFISVPRDKGTILRMVAIVIYSLSNVLFVDIHRIVYITESNCAYGL